MKKLVLDYSKWRCGEDDENNGLGVGDTLLSNREGYYCCLGLFGLQCGVEDSAMEGVAEPDEVVDYISYRDENDVLNIVWDTPFTKQAIRINDEHSTSPIIKITQLKTLCAENDIELEVINMPE